MWCGSIRRAVRCSSRHYIVCANNASWDSTAHHRSPTLNAAHTKHARRDFQTLCGGLQSPYFPRGFRPNHACAPTLCAGSSAVAKSLPQLCKTPEEYTAICNKLPQPAQACKQRES